MFTAALRGREGSDFPLGATCSEFGRGISTSAPTNAYHGQDLLDFDFCGIYGGSSPKRQKLYSNSLRLLFNLEQKAGRVEAGCFQELRGVELVSRKRRADGSLAWTGNENLRSSQFLASILMSFCGACVHIGQSVLRRYRYSGTAPAGPTLLLSVNTLRCCACKRSAMILGGSLGSQISCYGRMACRRMLLRARMEPCDCFLE